MNGYNDAVERLLLPLGDRILRTEFMATLERARAYQRLSAEAIAALQTENLTALLTHATTSVPHHRELGIEPHADPYEWLAQFPVVTKHTLRDHGARMLVDGTRADDLVAAHSSGSSGIQSTVYVTKAEQSRSQAYQTLFWEWAGYQLGAPLLQTGMTPDRGLVKSVKDRLLRTTYIEAFGVSDQAAVEVLRQGATQRSRHFGGYASSLYVFARAAARSGITDVSFDSVVSWGDKMFPEYRALIEAQFDTRVYDTYGCTEGIMVAAQHDLDQYYVLSPHVVVELLDEHDQPVPVGTLGRVVVTRLDAFAMPLIRYSLGDLAVAGERPPSAALGFPVLDRIIGRDTDLVHTPGGRTLIVHTFTGIFEFIEDIEQFRVVQRVPTGIEIEYVAGPDFSAATLELTERRLREVIDEPFDITFVPVSGIAPTASGKPQIVASYLGDEGAPGTTVRST